MRAVETEAGGIRLNHCMSTRDQPLHVLLDLMLVRPGTSCNFFSQDHEGGQVCVACTTALNW